MGELEALMESHWEKELSCASECGQCGKSLGRKDRRILSVYDHHPICMACKQVEETRADYPDQSKQTVAECIATTGKPYGDTASYCFHHFLPFSCKE
jgi:hypothetical protein